MTDTTPAEGSLPHHLEHLAMTADDVVAMITRSHEEGEIHPDTLVKTEKLAVGLRDVIHALMHHEKVLAATSDDVWRMLSQKHGVSDSGTVT